MAEKCMSFPARIFTCQYCNFIFKKRSHLLRHELIHNDERPFSCKTCGKSFRSAFHLNRHQATHSGIKNFRCEYEGCEVACITEWNLKRHIKRTHLGTFKCDKCDQEFRKNKLLQQHKYKHSKICCEFPGCAQVFSIPSKMRQHLKMHTEKGYICPVKGCSLKFTFWSECRLHAAQCKKKEVNCDICGKTFMERSNLKAHKKIHSEEREVFQCTYDGCGRFYTKQYNLKVHIQSFHLNIRPFVCSKDGCNKRFHFQHLLRKHLDSHDGNGHKENNERKRNKTNRINTTTISGITGFIPELWKKLTHEEIKSYVTDDEKSLSGNDDSTNDDVDCGTTHIGKNPPVEEKDETESDTFMPIEDIPSTDIIHSSDESSTITELVEIEPYLYKTVKTSKKTCVSKLKRSLSDPSPTMASKINTVSNMKHDVIKMEHVDSIKEFSNRFKLMLGKHHKPVCTTSNMNIHSFCRIQALTESDSSDSDVNKNQLQCVM